MLLDRLGLEVLLESLVVEVTLLLDARGVLQLEVALPAFRGFALALHLVLHPGQLFAPVVDPSLEKLFRAAHIHIPSARHTSRGAKLIKPKLVCTHLDPIAQVGLLGFEVPEVVFVLAETRFRLSQFIDVDRPVIEDANARRQFLRMRSRRSSHSASDLGESRKRRATTALPGSTASGR